ncbi:MAG: response regulator, partial [Bacteroidales bacterium]|nr:response regulator [Bacteroidales bacterium]
MAKILVIDDERSIRNTLRDILEYENYKVDDAENGIEGLKLVNSRKYDVILLDIKMPQMDGLEVLDHIMKITDTPVVMISGHGTIETAVEAIKKGAYDYIAKPLDLNRLLITIRNAMDKSTLIKETKTLKQETAQTWEMIGQSEAMMQVKELI